MVTGWLLTITKLTQPQQERHRMLTTLRNRNFSLLWLAGLISLMGNWMLIPHLHRDRFCRGNQRLADGLHSARRLV
jgi:hypothetical protein